MTKPKWDREDAEIREVFAREAAANIKAEWERKSRVSNAETFKEQVRLRKLARTA